MSGPLYQKLVEAGLMAAGISVIDIGVVPTPTLLAFVRERGLAGGILLTASHNPIEWNALKLVKRGGIFLDQVDFESLQGHLDRPPLYKAVRELGTVVGDPDAVDLHTKRLLQGYDLDPVVRAGISVAVDPVNAAGCVMDVPFLERLGCRVTPLNIELTGDFARPPEPGPAALEGLASRVRESGAAVGFAQDPDADRLALVDETGTALSEELTLALCLLSWYGRGGKGDAVVNMSTSRLNDDIAARFGFAGHRSRVGEANVLSMMRETGSPIGGEGNGGIILPALNPCRDSFVGMLLILDLLVQEGRPLSRIVASLPQYQMVKRKFPVSLPKGAEALLSAAFAAAGEPASSTRINRMDGLRYDFPQGWIHIRESNTEPVVRIIAESPSSAATGIWIAAAAGALEVSL